MEKDKLMERFINFLLRGILGMIIIYFGNTYLPSVISEVGIAYSLFNFLVVGTLGFPGVVLLFGINIYMIL